MSANKLVTMIQSAVNLKTLIENTNNVLEMRIVQAREGSDEYFEYVNTMMHTDVLLQKLIETLKITTQVLYSFGVDTYKSISKSKMHELSIRFMSLKKDDYKNLHTFMNVMENRIKDVQENFVIVNGI